MPENELALENIRLLVETINRMQKFTIKELVDEFLRTHEGKQLYIGTQTVHEFLERRREFGLLTYDYDVYSV